ncbi:MAG: hypothetical protein FJX74_17320, partial [Armatimonadetes bacterium]|nr:hypothetical protein [Armatimonadota bacterium]
MPKPRDPGRDLRESDGELPPDEPINLKATALFTDREEALAAFRRHAQAPPGRTLPVLSFYGVGGAGKTFLLQKL